MLAETGSARSSDCILDRAYFARLEKLAADSHIPYLQDYVRAMTDAANLRSLIRTQRLGLDAGFLREVLFPGRQRDAGGDPRRKRQRRCRAVAGHGLRPGGGAGRRGRQGRQPDRL